MSDNIERRDADSRIWVLGAPDPEMAAIEALLLECGERVVYATTAAGERIRPGQLAAPIHVGRAAAIYTVECDPPLACGEPEDEPDVDQVRVDGLRYLSARRCAEVSVIRIDHHRPGDPGYGRPPSEFLAASSIGQVIAELARLGRLPETWPRLCTSEGCTWQRGELVTRGGHPAQPHFPLGWWVTTREEGETGDASYGADAGETAEVPRDLVLCAAADHCLGAAYRGECPGVDPDELMRWRAESRARFQGRPVEEVLADVERAQAALRAAPKLALLDDETNCALIADLRDAYTVRTVLVEPFAEGATVDAAGVGDSVSIEFGPRDEGAWDEGSHHTFVRRGVAELPEAATRLGIGYISGPLVGPDGRQKITCSGTADQIRAFLDHWAPAQGLVDAYGDPQRGFAGAYLTTEGAS